MVAVISIPSDTAPDSYRKECFLNPGCTHIYPSFAFSMRRDPVVPETNPDHFQPPGLFREDDPLGIPRNPLQQPR